MDPSLISNKKIHQNLILSAFVSEIVDPINDFSLHGLEMLSYMS